MDIPFSSNGGNSSPRTLAIAGVILVVVSFGCLIAGAVVALYIDRFVDDATQATGTVVALTEHHDPEQNSTTYAPVFTFTTEDGRTQTVASRLATDPPSFRIGARVHVLYRRSDPAGARIDSFWQIWFWPVFLAGFGSVEFLVGTILLYTARRKHRKQGTSARTV